MLRKNAMDIVYDDAVLIKLINQMNININMIKLFNYL